MSIGKCFIPRSIIQNCHFNLDFFKNKIQTAPLRKIWLSWNRYFGYFDGTCINYKCIMIKKDLCLQSHKRNSLQAYFISYLYLHLFSSCWLWVVEVCWECCWITITGDNLLLCSPGNYHHRITTSQHLQTRQRGDSSQSYNTA